MKVSEKAKLIEECRKLRLEGCSLSEIFICTKLPKTTVYGYIRNIPLTSEHKRRIEQRRKELFKNRINPRKGKCRPGRVFVKPESWSNELIHIIAHFMFDGSIEKHGCVYYSSNKYQISHIKDLAEKLFGVKPTYRMRNNKVGVLSFYYVELANYVRKKKGEIFRYLKNEAPREEKRTFLQAFFDDEGNIYYNKDKRRVRGYQRSKKVLEEIKDLLREFGIEGKINKNGNEIEISQRENLIKFANEIYN